MSTFWFATLGALFAVYLALGGIDYGVALLLPTMGGEPARRAALNTIGPMFLGNEVWVVAVIGVLLAAFPGVESGLFNGTYPVLIVLILGLVAINAAVQLRGRADRRAGFDAVITGSGLVLAVGWGIVLAALLHGLPLTADGRVTGFANLFGPAALLFGVLTGVLALVQGTTFLGLPARRPFALIAAGLVVVVTLVEDLSLVLAGLLVLALVVVALTRSLLASSLAAALPVLIVGTKVFPDFLVSTVDPAGTVTVAGGASGDHALQVLTLMAVPLLPLLVLAQVACWWYFRRRPSTVYW